MANDPLLPALDRGCRTRPFRLPPPPGVEAMAALRSALWPAGTILRILFGAHGGDRRHGGTASQRAEVITAAQIISQHANVSFVEIGGLPNLSANALQSWLTAHPTIRCSFDPSQGSWSYVGKGILDAPPDQPTMNCGWPGDLGRSIHELLHGLGCEHEHQSFAVPWNVPNVLRYFEGPPNDWTERDVYEQVLTPLDPGTLVRSATIDVDSVMMYPFDPSLVTDRRFATGFKAGLSAGDILMMRRLWPH